MSDNQIMCIHPPSYHAGYCTMMLDGMGDYIIRLDDRVTYNIHWNREYLQEAMNVVNSIESLTEEEQARVCPNCMFLALTHMEDLNEATKAIEARQQQA